MKTMGIIGGIGPESTIQYYRCILAAHAERISDGSYPPIIINSIDLKKMLEMIAASEREKLADFLLIEIEKLARAGAECGLVAANAPHIVFDEVRRRSPIPLISIVEATRDAAQSMHLRKLGLFGARYTMQARFYPDVFSKQEIELAVPDEHDQAYIHHVYFHELVKGTTLDKTRERLLLIVDRMKEREGIQGLILGGTELSLILREAKAGEIPVLDTTQIHARAMVAAAFS